MKKNICIILIVLFASAQNIYAQSFGGDGSVQSKFVKAIVGGGNGKVTVMSLIDGEIPPGFHSQGNLFINPQLSFFQKSFFTAQIGTEYYTNNDILAPFPPTAHLLNSSGVSSVSKDVTGGVTDTIRTIWTKQNGVDIIQEIYCIDFTKSGQVVYSWKFRNTTSSPITVGCQYLQDVQITDPFAKQSPNSIDGPKILTKYQYDAYYTQFPNKNNNTLPWFYIGFLYDLPNAPTYNPGLSAMGYLDYGAPLNLIKPLRYSNGDWYTMASNIYGPASGGQGVIFNGNQNIGTDNAVLVEFVPRVILPGQTLEIGRTSYGNGEYDKCIGQLFSIVFYPHHLIWTPKPSPGLYAPNPIHIEKFVINPGPPQNINSSVDTRINLTVGNDLSISDSLCLNTFGKSQMIPFPPDSGTSIAPGGVGYFNWWACASPAEFCKGAVIDTLTFSALCSFCPPAFVDQIGTLGSDECQLLITLDCAEADINPPQFSDSLNIDPRIDTLKYINVHDWLATDRGLADITWVPEPKGSAGFVTDTTEFTITVSPPIQPCYNDKLNHIVTIVQKDSTIRGCFDFTFTDCIGNKSAHTVCIVAHPFKAPDVLPPLYENEIGMDTLHKEIAVHDDRSSDWGLKNISWLPINKTDTSKFIITYSPAIGLCDTDKTIHAVNLTQRDSTIGGCFSFMFEDCAGNKSYDTLCMPAHKFVFVGVSDGVQFELALEANRPNPFSHITTFTYSTGEYGRVRLFLYDELGKVVARIVDGVQEKGSHTIDFDGSKLSSSEYIVRLESGGGVVSRKVNIER
jgi:hypothetical protein